MIVNRPPFLSVRNLSKTFEIHRGLLSRDRQSVPALKQVSFEVSEGETVGLIGASGSGKSTVGRILTGLERADSGSIHFQGTDLVQLGAKERLDYRKHIQIVPQDTLFSLNPRRRVGLQIIDPMLDLGIIDSRAEARDLALDLLKRVGLSASDADKFPHEFSGGQRQRINIARTLGVNARVVVLDEPTSALDVTIQARILELLAELKSEFKLTYLFIGHNLAVVQSFCERILVMDGGEIVDGFRSHDMGHVQRAPATQRLVNAVLSHQP